MIGKLRKSQICKNEAVCKTTKYSSSLQEFDYVNRNVSKVRIVYEDQEVEHHDTHISYGFQSLTSEIGGVLGLTLGASILSMMNCVEKIFKNFSLFVKNRFNK